MYLKRTKDFDLKLSTANMKLLKWHIDASYAVHNDLRSHTGGNFTMGKGTIYGKSSKQKLNVKSSTEAELVGFDDCMPQKFCGQIILLMLKVMQRVELLGIKTISVLYYWKLMKG